jgi:hypothetical protein
MNKIDRIKKHIKDNAFEYTTLAFSVIVTGVVVSYLKKESDAQLVKITKDELERMNAGEALMLKTNIGDFIMTTYN